MRQVGSQEVNIVDVVKPLTKYAKTISSADSIPRELNKAIKIALSGRPGPVWLDLPLEYQWADVTFDSNACKKIISEYPKLDVSKKLATFEQLLDTSKTPILVLGYGVILSKTESLVRKFIIKNKLRCVTTWTAAGIFSSKDKHNLGIIGMSGQAGANKVVFNSDLLICLGSHLSIPHTTTLVESYAPKAKKIFINIDKDQLNNLNLNSDLSINIDLFSFMNLIKDLSINNKSYKRIDTFKEFNSKSKPAKKELVDPNIFFKKLTSLTTKDTAIVVDGGGTALYTGFQSSSLDQDQVIICSSAISSMGTGLAETIGCYMSNQFKDLICIIGDGSMLMNIQDLQSIADLNIPVIICIINNNGYLAIRHTQQGFLDNKYYGTHPDWKLGMVNFKKAANAFNIKYFSLEDNLNTDSILKKVLGKNYPIILEIKVPEDQPAMFKQGYKKNKDGTNTPLSLEFME